MYASCAAANPVGSWSFEGRDERPVLTNPGILYALSNHVDGRWQIEIRKISSIAYFISSIHATFRLSIVMFPGITIRYTLATCRKPELKHSKD